MKIKITFFILIILSISIQISAQSILNGTIISKTENEAISYVSIFVKSNPVNGVSSDKEGKFRIQCNQNDTLTVQCIGYKKINFLAYKAFVNPVIELEKDIVHIEEVSITAEKAYSMLIRVRDNTIKYTKKSFQGYCIRHDELSFNGNLEKTADSKIIFKSGKIRNKEIEVDYWLKEIKSESFNKTLKLPHVSYPNTAPFIPEIITALTNKTESKVKCTLKSISDSLMVINIRMEKHNRNNINDSYYFINTKAWLFNAIEARGDFYNSPINKFGRHYFLTDIKFGYNYFGDSIAFYNFDFNVFFSQKKANVNMLWDYQCKLKVVYSNNEIFDFTTKKLHQFDYLLFKGD